MPNPELYFDWKSKFVCKVKILVVTDERGGFGETDGFHLGQAFKVLRNDPWPHLEFELATAHRQGLAEPSVPGNFRFDAHNLSNYSQIWLFGAAPSMDPQTPAELRALTQFMDRGGGVFATGDHQELGRALNAEVPRVRSMRRWYHPDPGPNGEPVAPDVADATKHDTVMPNGTEAGSQSDKIPQPIRPTLYTRRVGGAIVSRVHQFPHPVLCGPHGRIEYLPDHMHEGLCEVPADLTRAWTFDGYTSVEYPALHGWREIPQVIGWATTRNTSGAEYGVLAAYNGHQADVGRVVVDATWHHWFNINLMGIIDATTPASPNYDPAVVPKWEAIKAYYRNVGIWLADKWTQRRIRIAAWLAILGYYDILMTLRPLDRVRDRLLYYWQLGVFARDAFGRLAPQCQATKWALELVPWLNFQLSPWPGIGPPLPDPPPWLDTLDVEHVALGGAVHELASRFLDADDAQSILDRQGDEVDALLARGAKAGVAELLQKYTAAGRDAAQLEQLLSAQP